MRATNRAIPIDMHQAGQTQSGAAAVNPAQIPAPRVPALRMPELRVSPLAQSPVPRRFGRVPTYSIGVVPDHREYPRATLKLPLRLRAVAGVSEEFPITLVTRDISSTGVFFLSPKSLPMGASVELEIVLVSRPMGCGNVVIATMALVRRVEPAAMPTWFGIAASFDDVQFGRDDGLPGRFGLL